MKINLQPLERAQLREFLVSQFSQDELELLAFDLGVDYEMLSYQNKEKLSLELVAYFLRRDRLSCLLTEIMRQRPRNNLAYLLEKMPACIPITKIQIIVHTSPEVTDEIEAFLEFLTQKHNLSREDVSLIAVARGSIRLLLCLPDHVIHHLQPLDSQLWSDTPSPIIEAKAFEELSARSQKIWRMIAKEWPPVIFQDKLLPRIPWQKAAEIYQLKEKDELMNMLAAGDEFGAHGIRVTLTALSGYAQLLTMAGDLNEKQTSYVDKLVKAADDLSETLTVLFYLINARVEEVTVQTLLQYVLTSITFILEQANIQLDLALADELTASQQLIRANLAMLTKSVVALVQNAVQLSPENGRIQLSAHEMDNQLVIRVRDEGDTLSAETAERLFDAYRQRSHAERGQFRVNGGLGLTFVKLVTEQVDGKIWFEQQAGVGNVFCISFPLKHEEAD